MISCEGDALTYINFAIGMSSGVAIIGFTWRVLIRPFSMMRSQQRKQQFSETFQLVPIGARIQRSNNFHNNEEHSSCSYESFLMGAYDTDSQRWQSVCWVDFGFTNEQRTALSTYLSSSCSRVDASENFETARTNCDVWFEPRQVWKIKSAAIFLSQDFHCARAKVGQRNKGLSLKHPRFMGSNILNEEIDIEEQITKSDELLNHFYNQDSIDSEQSTQTSLDDMIERYDDQSHL